MHELHCPGICVRRTLTDMGPGALILDHRIGDVTGEGCPQDVYLLGVKPGGLRSIYCAGVTLAVASRWRDICVTRPLPMDSGFDPRLVLCPLTGGGVEEMVVHVFSDECGGRDGSCVLGYAGGRMEMLFDYRLFNRAARYRTAWRGEETVEIRSDGELCLLRLDPAGRSPEAFFGPVGSGRRPAVSVEPLSLLTPCPPRREGPGGLLAVQPIHAGGRPAGVLETCLVWDGAAFTPRSVSARPLPGLGPIPVSSQPAWG